VQATLLAGALVGASAAVYTLASGRSPAEVGRSGEATLEELATAPERWSVVALLLLLVCKGVAYGVSLGAFRCGPVFPAVFLGCAVGVLLAPLPGLGTVPTMAIGMAAGTAAALRLRVFSILLVVLLLGPAAASQIPVIILSAVTAYVVAELLASGRTSRAATQPAPGVTAES